MTKLKKNTRSVMKRLLSLDGLGVKYLYRRIYIFSRSVFVVNPAVEKIEESFEFFMTQVRNID